ncbi:hypothetical protein [Amycolatopsis alba]|uniref:DUF304 domain-containing protein n=1 Tax=Amycolatopsis alba DSM 44262 TaxID=1125972 RepID=A0A229RHF0_AMYAL|nr:hypothetical protein [Amycolatopsis alba]OXM46078.1 hypothetical protein CFP75_29015 [Amycolatopsis alba DSM 44262]
MQLYPLQEGEEVLWTGAPQRPRKWFPEHIQMVALAVPFVFLFFVWVEHSGLPPFIGLFAAFFILFHQRLSDRRSRENVLTYMVTNQRIIFVANWQAGTEFRWVWFRYLQHPPEVKVDETGVGTVTYGSRWGRSRVRSNELRGAWAAPVLELRAIPDARRVADLIEEARNWLIATYTQAP